MSCKWIVGGGEMLDIVQDAWTRAFPEIATRTLAVPQNRDYSFHFDALDALDAARDTAFVAFDERFGNFKRLELVQALQQKGFSLEPLVSPLAMLAGGVEPGPNAFIGDGTIVGCNSSIGLNAFVSPGVRLGSRVQIGASCWLESGTIVGNGAAIGPHCVVRSGAIVSANVRIGENCTLGWPRLYERDVPNRTHYAPGFDEPILVYG